MSYQLPEELIFLKNRNSKQKNSIESIKDKICIVTGATSGVGLESAKRLAAGGAYLVMVARNEAKANFFKAEIQSKWDVEVDVLIADFSSLSDVRRVGAMILEKYPVIDVFINSAGLHSTKIKRTQDGHEMVFCVNHLAPFLLTNLLLERFKKCGTRILLVNSEGHRFNGLDPDDLNWNKRVYTGLRGYGASKTAQLLTMIHFNELLKDSDATINAVHPGDVKTNIGNNNGGVYKWFLHHVTWHILKDPEIAGDALYYLATASELQGISGRFFNLTIDELPAKHARDKFMAQIIWDLSSEMTELS